MRSLITAAAILAFLGTADAGKKKPKKAKATTGTITGVITAKGEQAFAEADLVGSCDATKPPAYPVIVDASGKLAGAYVYLTRADGKALPAAAVPTAAKVVTQDGCLYRPKVSVAITGQSVEIRNADPAFHNVRATTASKTAFNLAQPEGAQPIVRSDLGGAGKMELACDVHPWMHAYVMVSDHAYATVTGADGKYTFKDVPPGKYEVHAWHPDLDPTNPKKVTVKKGKTAKASLSLDRDD